MSEQDYREKQRKEDELTAQLLRRLKEVKTIDEFLSVVRDGATFALAKHVENMSRDGS